MKALSTIGSFHLLKKMINLFKSVLATRILNFLFAFLENEWLLVNDSFFFDNMIFRNSTSSLLWEIIYIFVVWFLTFVFCSLYLFIYLLWLQIRTLGMLRSRFQSLPGAFNACLIPEEKTESTKKKGLKATFSRKFEVVAYFSSIFISHILIY